jgi:hypothetical protein
MVFGDVKDAIDLAIAIGKILKDGYEFPGECAKLKTRCDALDVFLKQNAWYLADDPSVAQLREQLQAIHTYLTSCKKRSFFRNPISESTFHKVLPGYAEALSNWTISVILSINVRTR